MPERHELQEKRRTAFMQGVKVAERFLDYVMGIQPKTNCLGSSNKDLIRTIGAIDLSPNAYAPSGMQLCVPRKRLASFRLLQGNP